MYIAIFNPKQKEPVMDTKLYCGIDLHSSNCYLGIIDQTGKRVFHRRIKNDLELILKHLEPFRASLKSTGLFFSKV